MSALTKYIKNRKRKFSMNTKEITKTSDNTLTIDAKEAGNAVDYSIYGNIPKSRNLVPYPYPIFVNSTVYTKNGITLQDLGDGSIMVNGTATESTTFSIIPAFLGYRLPYSDYFCLSGCPYSKGDILLKAKINKYSTTNEAVAESEALDYGTTALLNAKKLTNPSTYGYLDERDKICNNYVLTLDISISKDAVIDYQIIKPQINMGNEPLEYERGYFSDRRIDFLDTDGYENNILKINKDYYRIKYDNKEYLNYDQNINKTSNGVTLTSYTDKILNLNGTATADTFFLLATGDNTLFSKFNQYKIYGANNDVKISVVFYDATDAAVKESIAPTTYPEHFKSDINLNDITEEYTTIRIFLSINNGTVLNNVKIVPSIKAIDNKYNRIIDQNNIEIDPYKTYMLSGARDRANFTLTYYKNNEVVNTQTNIPRNLIKLPYISYNISNNNTSSYKYYQNGKVIFIGKPSFDEYIINDSITVNPNTQYTFFPNTVYMQDIEFIITEYNNNNELIGTNTYDGYLNNEKTIGYLVSNHYNMNYTDDMAVNNRSFRTRSTTAYIKISISFGDYPLYNGIPKLIEHSDTIYTNIIQYPYNFSAITKNGVTITPNSSNKIILSGSATDNFEQIIYTNLNLDKHKKYILTGGEGGAYLKLSFYKGNKLVNDITSNEWNNATIIDIDAIDYEYDNIKFILVVRQYYSFGNMPIYPRLEEYDDNDDIILIEPKDYVEHDTCKLTYTVPDSITNNMIKPKLRECEIVGVGDKTINILPYPYTKQFTTTYNQDGITAQVKADGSIVLNGTCTKASGKTYIQIASIKNVPAGTYTLSGYPSDGLAANCGVTAEAWSSDTVKTAVYWENQNIPYEKRTNTTSDTSIIKVFIFVNAGFNCDGIVIKPQFELNSVATKYEKYDSSRDTIKNLIPFPYLNIVNTKTISGITFTDNFDGTITANGTSTADIKLDLMERYKSSICLQPNKKYIISGSAYNGITSLNYGVSCDRLNDANIGLGGGGLVNGTEKYIFTIPNDDWDDFYKEKLYIYVNNNTTIDNLTFKPMLIDIDELPNERKRWIYPYVMPDSTSPNYTSNGITFTTINDGDILVTGQIADNTKHSAFDFRTEYETKNLFDNEAYYISGVPEISGSKSRIMFYFCNNGTVVASQPISSSGGVVQTTKSFNQIICKLFIPHDDTTVFNHVFKIKITKIGYEPYGYKIPFVRKPYNYLHYPYNYATITKNGVKVKELPDGSYVMNGSYNNKIDFTMKNYYAPRKAIPDSTILILQDFKKEVDISTWAGCFDDNSSYKWTSFCKNLDKMFIGNVISDNYKNQALLKLMFIIYNGTYAYNVRFMPYLRLAGDPYVYTTAYLDKPLRRGENLNYIDNLLPDLPVNKGINDFYVNTYYKPKKSVIKYISK